MEVLGILCRKKNILYNLDNYKIIFLDDYNIYENIIKFALRC